MENRFLGRDIVDKPSCPFCQRLIDPPKELATRMPNEMPVGECSCGAVYAYDATGHNLGTAMIDALVFGCNGDWDLAWGLLPEEDYLEKLVEHYDDEAHLIVHAGVYEGRRVAGTLYFIKLHKDVREVTQKGVKQQLKRATGISDRSSPKKKGGRKSFSKKEIEDLVRDYRIEKLMGMAEQDKRIIRDLQRLLYSVDRLLRCRAADVLGQVSALIARNDPGTISRLLQGLFTSLTDTAASAWGSLDAIGEIISNNPAQFSGYIPQLYHLTRDRALLSEVLRALCIIAKTNPGPMRKTAYQIIPFLKDPDQQVRGYAALLLGNLGAYEDAKDDLENLINDPSSIEFYEQGELVEQPVGRLAYEAIHRTE